MNCFCLNKCTIEGGSKGGKGNSKKEEQTMLN